MRKGDERLLWIQNKIMYKHFVSRLMFVNAAYSVVHRVFSVMHVQLCFKSSLFLKYVAFLQASRSAAS